MHINDTKQLSGLPKTSIRGGKRPGAGRPAAPDSRRTNVILPESIRERAREIGNGNISRGIVLAITAYLKK